MLAYALLSDDELVSCCICFITFNVVLSLSKEFLSCTAYIFRVFARSGLTRVVYGYPHLRGGNPQSYACGASAG